MGFPIPGDAIEQRLDLNRHLVHNSAATFFMRVEGNTVADGEVGPGDLLVVDRSLDVQHQSLVVGVVAGELVVLRVSKQGNRLRPAGEGSERMADSLEVWGVVSYIIREV
jgi:DNA polymerase V